MKFTLVGSASDKSFNVTASNFQVCSRISTRAKSSLFLFLFQLPTEKRIIRDHLVTNTIDLCQYFYCFSANKLCVLICFAEANQAYLTCTCFIICAICTVEFASFFCRKLLLYFLFMYIHSIGDLEQGKLEY